ncbi:MAG: dihydrolipoyl dehydrogenase [Neisseriaceae bacterium]|nr:dihydrolipoyl dehydrogenase [Neisseriaceae bacterium]
MSEFDVVVIGAGPGGYIAAIRAAQLGFKVACIDAGKNKKGDKPALGGTCLNVGCIPSKALLQSSEEFHKASHELEDHGISIDKVKIDIPKMIARKDAIVTKLTSGVGFLFKKNKVENIHGHASFKGKDGEWYQIEVTDDKNSSEVKAKNVIIATGSKPRQFPSVEIDNVNILDNVGALDLEAVPKKLGMIGSGVIGLEMSSVWNRLGSEVTILEALPTFLPMADQQIAKEAFKIFTKNQKLDIKLGAKVLEVHSKGKQVKVKYELDGKTEEVTFDKLIIAIGRVPNTENLNLDAVGVTQDDRGFIEVDENCSTKVENIWAIGDVVRGPMLAHKASEEGVAVAERIAGQKPHFNLDIMPSILYTTPEIAWVGKTEEQLKEAGVKYKKGTSSFAPNGRALAMGAAQGTVKVLADEKTDRILGVHMIGPMVSELLAEAVEALEFSASSEDIARIVHAHPTLSEVIHEASLAVDKRALNG